MDSEMRDALKQASEQGEFRGQVLQSLADTHRALNEIKRVLEDMTSKHEVQDSKIDSKVSRAEFEKFKEEQTKENALFKKYFFLFIGGIAVIETLFVLIGQDFFNKLAN